MSKHKIKTDLQAAFEHVEILKNSREHKQTLKEFLNELWHKPSDKA